MPRKGLPSHICVLSACACVMRMLRSYSIVPRSISARIFPVLEQLGTCHSWYVLLAACRVDPNAVWVMLVADTTIFAVGHRLVHVP